MSEKLYINKKSSLKGDDGHQIFTVRMHDDLVSDLESIVKSTNRSRNEVINLMLKYAIEKVEIVD